MPRSKEKTPAAAPRDGQPDLERLTAAVESLCDEVRVLREAIDELREEYTWAVRNHRLGSAPLVVHVTSMPADPLADDFGERLNRLKPKDLPPESAQDTGTRDQPTQQELWE